MKILWKIFSFLFFYFSSILLVSFGYSVKFVESSIFYTNKCLCCWDMNSLFLSKCWMLSNHYNLIANQMLVSCNVKIVSKWFATFGWFGDLFGVKKWWYELVNTFCMHTNQPLELQQIKNIYRYMTPLPAVIWMCCTWAQTFGWITYSKNVYQFYILKKKKKLLINTVSM